MTNPTCKTCRYWKGVVGTTCGACCVRAPFYNPVFAEDDNYDGHWPFTEEKAWCGEHKLREDLEETKSFVGRDGRIVDWIKDPETGYGDWYTMDGKLHEDA